MTTCAHCTLSATTVQRREGAGGSNGSEEVRKNMAGCDTIYVPEPRGPCV